MIKILAAFYTIFAIAAHADVKIYKQPEKLGSYAFGSGLHRVEGGPNRFVMTTDRGPNADGPKVELGDGERLKSKIFPNPEFNPTIAFVRLDGGEFVVEKLLPITDSAGRATSGISAKDDEAAFDLELNRIRSSRFGIDPEGIAVAKDGAIWIVEEERPSIIKLTSEGRIEKIYSPGDGIPSFFKERKPNRGFEGIKILPDGSILATLQSPIPEMPTSCAAIPFVILNPKSGETDVVGFPLSWPEEQDIKVGDVEVVSDNEVLLIVNREVEEGVINDIVSFKWERRYLPEQINKLPNLLCSGNSQVKTILNLNSLGWRHAKAEGLARSADGKKLYVANDNDFGLRVYIDPKRAIVDSAGNITLKKKKERLFTAEYLEFPGTEIWEIDLPQ